MQEQEEKFEKFVPEKSVLGREYQRLLTERYKQQEAFNSDRCKMGFDTTPLRRATIALEKFLDNTLPGIFDAMMLLEEARENLAKAEEKAQLNDWHGIVLQRKDEYIIWTRHALSRCRSLLPKRKRVALRRTHPQLWKQVRMAWREFRKESQRWRYGSQPFDGSQAMHLMHQFVLSCYLSESAND